MCLLKQRQLSSSSTVSVVITKKFCWHTPVQYWMSHYKWDMALCCKPGHPTQFKPAWVPPNAWKKLSCTYRPCFLWLWLTARSSCTNRLGSDRSHNGRKMNSARKPRELRCSSFPRSSASEETTPSGNTCIAAWWVSELENPARPGGTPDPQKLWDNKHELF